MEIQGNNVGIIRNKGICVFLIFIDIVWFFWRQILAASAVVIVRTRQDTTKQETLATRTKSILRTNRIMHGMPLLFLHALYKRQIQLGCLTTTEKRNAKIEIKQNVKIRHRSRTLKICQTWNASEEGKRMAKPKTIKDGIKDEWKWLDSFSPFTFAELG